MAKEDVIVNNVGDSTPSNGALVVDVGKKQSKKRIKQLRKGRGKLIEQIQKTISELRERQEIDENAQPIVFIVRQKRKSGFGGLKF